MAFLTERETESLLTPEVRFVPMPDGTTKAVSSLKLMWANYDFLIELNLYTHEQLIDLILRNAEDMDYSLNESFDCVVAYCSNSARDKLAH